MSVAQILNAKGSAVVTAAAGDTISSVATTLAQKRIGSIVVLELVGSHRRHRVRARRCAGRREGRRGGARLARQPHHDGGGENLQSRRYGG